MVVVSTVWLIGPVLRRFGGHLPLHHSLLLLQLLLGLVCIPLLRGTGGRHEWGPEHAVTRREKGG